MQAQQAMRQTSVRAFAVLVAILVVGLLAFSAITIATVGAGRGGDSRATQTSSAPAGGYNDLAPDRTHTHGDLP